MNKEELEDITIIIPSLNPDTKLVTYVNELITIGFTSILIVNDGSQERCDTIFSELSKKSEVTVLRHEVNKGKGRALKTAFAYYLENNSKMSGGVVTADADGQHSAKDTYQVAATLHNTNKIILGTRNFNEQQVPFKSKFGNKLTTVIFMLLYGLKIHDTQTGLRGIPFDTISEIIKLDGEKFDYEIHVLIYVVSNKIAIEEVEIETIYIDDNRETHFDAVKDSIRIYKVMFKQFFTFIISSLLSSCLDIASFYILLSYVFSGFSISEKILISTIVARVISSLFNYFVNHKIVFKSTENINKTLLKYYTLCIVQMLLSALLVVLVEQVGGGSPTIIKVFVDLFLFFISYQLQNRFIFKRHAV